jgi:hypothetical protein
MSSRLVALTGALSLVACCLAPSLASAQAGSTVTPDRLTYVVNKDLAGERWTITMNLASVDPPRLINVTGNVFRPGGGPPSFIWCQIRPDSTGNLSDPNSTFALRCYGTSACGQTATACARDDWRLIAERVEIQARFFLPEGVSIQSGAAPASAPAALAPITSAASTPPASPAQAASRGATLPPDASQFLVNKDVGDERWSISLNLVPSQSGALDSQTILDALNRGRIDNRLLSVTGNVFPPDGGAQFVYCQELAESQGNLADPSSPFVFSCVGTGACQRSPEECAREEWRDIPAGERLTLPASFFLPEAGLPAPPLSDSDLIVIGRTSDPPSIEVPIGGASSALGSPAGGCAVGQSCSVPVGSCGTVQGQLVDGDAGCACRIDRVPPECILCDGGSNACGGECQYQAGGATARGTCLPFSSSSGDCACVATDPSNPGTQGICGGSLNATCPEDRCCADDPRDGCDPSRGDHECAGICVDSGGCDPTTSQCGQCLDQRGASGGSCGGSSLEPGQDCCGDTGFCDSCFCEAGSSCVTDASEDFCCPTSTPLYCPFDDICIPDGADCCPTGDYCGVGYECTPNPEECCPVANPWYCPDGSGCIEQGGVCCAGDGFCSGGQFCGRDGRSCIPAGKVDCGANGAYCEPGQICVPNGDGFGCRDATSACPDGSSCPGGFVCTWDEEICCSANSPTLCEDGCYEAGASCCDQGGGCDAGSTCTSDPDLCCSAETPFLCPGTTLCTADARECCGDGRYCDTGLVCTNDPGLCCPAETPVLCPNRQDCAVDLAGCNSGLTAGTSSISSVTEAPAGSRPATPRLQTTGEQSSRLDS